MRLKKLPAAVYTEYLNINMFGFPAGNRRMMLILLPVLLTVFIYLCVRMQAKRYPEGNRDYLSGIVLRMNTVLDQVRTRFAMGMWEAYKVLFLEFGVVIMVIVIVSTGSLSYTAWTMIPEDMRAYYMYVKDMQGPIGDQSEAASYIAHARESAENSNNPYELRHALDMLEERVTELQEKGSAESFEPWILYDMDFNAYYGEKPVNRRRKGGLHLRLF